MKTNGVHQLWNKPSVKRAALAKYLGDKFSLSHRQVDQLLKQTKCSLSDRTFTERTTRIVVIARGHGHYQLACRDAQPTHEVTVVHHTDDRLLEFWGDMIEQWQNDHRPPNGCPVLQMLFHPAEPIRLIQSSSGRRKHKKVRTLRRGHPRRFAPRYHRR